MERIFARATNVVEVSPEECRAFLEENHRQGATKSAIKTLSLGLYHKDLLVGVAQFCSPRTPAKQREYSMELLRMAFKNDWRVVGGASKLMEHFRRIHNPADIFTYQAMDGEGTAVYEHCGFIVAEEASPKQYLVAPGKTLKTGSRREVLGMAYAVRYGPDRITGSKLGEMLHEDGTRKSNQEIFVEDLGWHVEQGPGDRVYEWFNPNYTFYTYKVTATDSAKYYYGVSHVKKANATRDDCMADGYFGSGGLASSKTNKYANWKRKHRSSLIKEVIGVFSRKGKAYAAEKVLVGDLWKTDPLCLNSTAGGKLSGMNAASSQARRNEQVCPIHGLTKHQGNTCNRCGLVGRDGLALCETHGNVLHRGATCLSCMNANRVTAGVCDIHGPQKFLSGTCYLCRDTKASLKECAIHGLTKHRGESCDTCTMQKATSVRTCPIHGDSKHRGEACQKCAVATGASVKECPIHGMANHQGQSCRKCAAAKGAHARSHGSERRPDCRYCLLASEQEGHVLA